MNVIRWIGFAAFFASSLVIGIRLVALARRTGQLPELLIGVGVLGMGPFGYGLSTLADASAETSGILSATFMGSALLALTVGTISQYLFVWMVFRRAERWAPWVFLGAAALATASYALDIHGQGLVDRGGAGPWQETGRALRMGCLFWSSAESLRYHRLMRRRERVGLGDPVVTNRFLLWGIGAGAAFLGTAVANGLRATTGLSVSEVPLVSLVVSLHGLVAAVAMWLAFRPPAAYLRWIHPEPAQET